MIKSLIIAAAISLTIPLYFYDTPLFFKDAPMHSSAYLGSVGILYLSFVMVIAFFGILKILKN